MAPTAEKEHGQGFATARPELVAAAIDAGAQTGPHAGRQFGAETQQVIAVRQSAHLHLIEGGQHAEFVAQGAQVFDARLHLIQDADHVAQAAPNGLEVDVVLEQRRSDAAKLAAVLRHGHVLQLQHIDLAAIELAVDEPFQIVIGELANRMRFQRAHAFGPPAGPYQPLGGGAEGAQFLVGRFLRWPVQQLDDVYFGELRHLAQSLVHEDAAAVDGRADEIRRDEQDARTERGGLQDGEAIAEVAAQWAFEGFGVADPSERQRAAPCAHGLRKLPEGPPEGGEVRAQRDVSEHHGENGAGPGEEEVRRQAWPLVNILPAEKDVVLLEDCLDLLFGELLADGAPVFVEYHAARLVQDLPTALPCHVAEVGVFQVEGFQQPVESAEFEKLRAVEGATAAAAVEAGEEVVDCIVDAVPDTQAAVLPPALGEAGLLTEPG